jgi:ankyrin repeat protein
LYEAVRYDHAAVVDLLMSEVPDMSSVATEGDDGISPLYLAAAYNSVQIVRDLLRPSQDGTPSPASSSGPEGRTALHVAATDDKGTTKKRHIRVPECTCSILFCCFFYCNRIFGFYYFK